MIITKNTYIILFFIFTKVSAINIIQAPSSNFDERIDKRIRQIIKKPKFIILHYTTDCHHIQSKFSLSNFFRPVSSHYLIAVDGTIYQLVDDSKRAWHAGKSFWDNNDEINTYSIGIEIVNPGHAKYKKDPCIFNNNIWNKNTGVKRQGLDYIWYPFTDKQIDSVIVLCQDLIKKYNIKPQNVLGHSDIAPGRKFDPGPLFPWKKLAEHNIGMWYSEKKSLPYHITTIKHVQKLLKVWGYDIHISGKLDKKTQTVIRAFQMHFRPNNIDGTIDQETCMILEALISQIT